MKRSEQMTEEVYSFFLKYGNFCGAKEPIKFGFRISCDGFHKWMNNDSEDFINIIKKLLMKKGIRMMKRKGWYLISSDDFVISRHYKIPNKFLGPILERK